MTAQGMPTPGPFWRRIKPSFGADRKARLAKASAELHREFAAGQRGFCYDDLFGAYLTGAHRVIVTDPFIQEFYQVRNLMELLETIVRHNTKEQTIIVHLITGRSKPEYAENQASFLDQIEAAAPSVGIRFSWEFAPLLHDRSIMTDSGWKIVLGRGLDIFQWYDVNNAFDFQNRLQICRAVKGFSMTVLNAPQGTWLRSTN